MKKVFLLALLSMSLNGFAQSLDPLMPPIKPLKVLETIKMDEIYSWDDRMLDPMAPFPVSRQHSVIKFSALSSGCTDEKSFEVDVVLDPVSQVQEISVVRIVPDTCRALSHWVNIELSLKTPLEWFVPVKIANPFPATFEIVY